MNRSFLYGLFGLVGVAAVGLVPVACTAGGVGVPCIPEDEYNFRFPGFKVTEDIIESRSFQCATRICLVNHFQGRVSCPLGQPSPKDKNGNEGCDPQDETSCGAGRKCVSAGSFSPSCDPSQGDAANSFCASLGSGACNDAGFCECVSSSDCPQIQGAVVSCDAATKQCVSYACIEDSDDANFNPCQDPSLPPSENAGKACCVPGTRTPVTTPVCGQCKGQNDEPTRDAENAVYCSCRCGVADGEPEDPNYNFCTCPTGFECAEIRKNVGLGDPYITGKYCIKEGTQYDANEDQCGQVDGYWVQGGEAAIKCEGVGSGKCQTPGGNCD